LNWSLVDIWIESLLIGTSYPSWCSAPEPYPRLIADIGKKMNISAKTVPNCWCAIKIIHSCPSKRDTAKGGICLKLCADGRNSRHSPKVRFRPDYSNQHVNPSSWFHFVLYMQLIVSAKVFVLL
jgi:hypothetical protein